MSELTLTRRDLLQRGGLVAAGALALGTAGVAAAPEADAFVSRVIGGDAPVPFTTGHLAFQATATHATYQGTWRHFFPENRNKVDLRNDTTGRITQRTRTYQTIFGSSSLLRSTGWGTINPGQTVSRACVRDIDIDVLFQEDRNTVTYVDFYRTDQTAPAVYNFRIWWRYYVDYPYWTRSY